MGNEREGRCDREYRLTIIDRTGLEMLVMRGGGARLGKVSFKFNVFKA
jgi:hypothetical protein